MPHLYFQASSKGLKKDIEDFILQGPQDLRAALESSIENEDDSIKKKKMEDKFEQLGVATSHAKRQLEKTLATDDEMLYLLNRWYKKHHDNFLDLEEEIKADDFDDFLVMGGFKNLLSSK
jgi:hypothetical protein